MFSRLRRATAAFCIIAMVVGIASPSSAGPDDIEEFINSTDTVAKDLTSPPMVDLLILRPVGLLTMTLSGIFFVFPVVPLTLLTRPTEIEKPFKVFIINPMQYVWMDPLGSH